MTYIGLTRAIDAVCAIAGISSIVLGGNDVKKSLTKDCDKCKSSDKRKTQNSNNSH